MNGELYPGEFEAMERQGRFDAVMPNKEKQIQDYERKKLIEELSKMPPMVMATAYLYTLYGEAVTEKWLTATQNVSALENAYEKGYYDALQRLAEIKEDKMSDYILELEEACNTLKKHCEAQEKCEGCICYGEKWPYCLLKDPPEVWPINKIFNNGE